jgi:hypothetical protein
MEAIGFTPPASDSVPVKEKRARALNQKSTGERNLITQRASIPQRKRQAIADL